MNGNVRSGHVQLYVQLYEYYTFIDTFKFIKSFKLKEANDILHPYLIQQWGGYVRLDVPLYCCCGAFHRGCEFMHPV